MQYYPVFLDIKSKDCLVVGGGNVGARKTVTLEKCGANVKVISDRFSPLFDDIKKTNICLEKKEYEKKDVKGMTLVFAATNNTDLNQQIKNDASQLDIFCNIADAPGTSDFLLPSIVDRGDLILAVSTSGSSPAMAKKIKQDLEDLFGPEYERLLSLMGSIRKKLLSTARDSNKNKIIFYTLIEKGILELIKKDDEIRINEILHDVLGTNYSYQDLVSSRSDK